MAAESSNFNIDVNNTIDIHALPEGCIASALSLTSPLDAARLSLVDPTFRSAAQSDAVWESFLPTDYKEIISQSVNGQNLLKQTFQSKKELYFSLCDNHFIFDNGYKSFQLEKLSGKKCYMLSARNLYIEWSETSHYWHWTSERMSRFKEVAELLNVCWLEIRGKISISMLSQDTTYAAYLVFTTKPRNHGLNRVPAEGSVNISGEESETRKVFFDSKEATRHSSQNIPRREGFSENRLATSINQQTGAVEDITEYASQRDDGWTEVKVGELYIKEGQEGDFEMSLLEIKGGNWKGGVIIEGFEIRPVNK